MDVLTEDVYNFLKEEMKFETAYQFLGSQTAMVASQYELWREANGKPSLRQDTKSVVYAWKQEVTRRIRSNDTKQAATTTTTIVAAANHNVAASTITSSNGSSSHSPSSCPPSSSRMLNLPMTSKKKQRQQQHQGSTIKEYIMRDEHVVEPSPSNPSNSRIQCKRKKKKNKESVNKSPFEMHVADDVVTPVENDGTLK
jgi:hypothetical protein